jgi:chitinase
MRSVVFGCSAALMFTAGCAGDITAGSGAVAAALGQPAPLPMSSGLQARVLRGSNDEPLCVDIAGARNDYGSDLILYPCHGGANQRFNYNRSSGVLHSQLSGDWCLDGGDPSGRMQLWGCNNTGPQNFAYEEGTGLLRYRGIDNNKCVDATGGTLRTAPCTGAPEQQFTLHTRYGDRRFHELTSVATHNSFSNNEEGSWVAPNQGRSITHQLEDGVRALMLDVWSFKSSTAQCVVTFGKDCYPQDLYMCHGGCSGVPGVNYTLPRETVAQGLQQVVSFLQRNPEELVTVFLEDYSAHDELQRVLNSVGGLRDLQFNPYGWDVMNRGWPRADEMVSAGQRLLLISDHGDKRDLGVGFGQDLTVENYWSIGSTNVDYTCRSRWDGIPLDRTDGGFERLFVMNHFRDVPATPMVDIDNSYANLMSRVTDWCVPAAKRKPNYLAVDYYDWGKGGVDRTLNDVDRTSVILFNDIDFGGKAQLLGPGSYNLADLAIGAGTVSSVKVASGTKVVLQRAGGNDTRSFTATARYVGDDFNDQTATAVITRTGR